MRYKKLDYRIQYKRLHQGHSVDNKFLLSNLIYYMSDCLLFPTPLLPEFSETVQAYSNTANSMGGFQLPKT